ncbi:hypothetical protein S14_173 [Shewanella sp. phage 1/4]|uniref:hypothetical protein n=1 Tax=Shewanella phage 1/4 TaxID=1458859 RepID=UPI0004F83ED7|nr:hypothetical protein S14_173 [Shewanella sp. phage 1/4]AHK11282.1 hypothetical protein S14_173 [Shewanella sp. phage 1/4]
MNPILFPAILILYAEGSYCEVTRKVARIVLYSYLLTLITTTYMPTVQGAHFSLVILHTACYIFCIGLCQKLEGKVVFFIILVGLWWIDLSIILNTLKYDVVILGYSLLNYSNYFYREFTILAVSLCAYISTTDRRHNTRENLIGVITLALLIVEKQF